jgi:histidinol-phosphatase (PHP family)
VTIRLARPELIDQHVHTSFSPDSKVRLEEIVRQAVSRGKRAVVTTDHFDYDCKYFKRDVLIDMPAYEAEVSRLAGLIDIDVRKGIEVGWRADYHAEIQAYLTRYSFDLVLLSVHNDGVLDFAEEQFHEKPIDEVFADYFGCACQAVDRMDDYDVVAHLDYFTRYAPRPVLIEDYERNRGMLNDLLKLIIEKEKALELNTAGLYRQGWIHPHPYMIRMYTDLGGRLFSLGSDAHRLEDYERGLPEAIELLVAHRIDEVVQFKNRKPYFVEIGHYS